MEGGVNNMKIGRRCTIFSILFVIIIASGCAVNKETMNAYNEAKEAFQKATLIGAKKCAPCQYATAEAYIAIADHEIKEYWRELEYLDKHIKIIKEKSLEAIRICEKPPTPPSPPAIVPPPPSVKPSPAITPPPVEKPLPPAVPPPEVVTPPAPAVTAPPPVEKPVTPPPSPTPIVTRPPEKPAPPEPPAAPVFEPVYFDINKSIISPIASKALDRNGMILKDNPEIKVLIEGHTDSTGTEKLNQILSEKRAESTKRYLIDKFQISAERMKIKGYGSKRPVADNATPEGRAKNRRVEFRVIP